MSNSYENYRKLWVGIGKKLNKLLDEQRKITVVPVTKGGKK